MTGHKNRSMQLDNFDFTAKLKQNVLYLRAESRPVLELSMEVLLLEGGKMMVLVLGMIFCRFLN